MAPQPQDAIWAPTPVLAALQTLIVQAILLFAPLGDVWPALATPSAHQGPTVQMDHVCPDAVQMQVAQDQLLFVILPLILALDA